MGKYFTIEELLKSSEAERLNIRNLPDKNALKSLERLIDNLLDPVREMWGAPVEVTSGFRSDELNRAVNGVVNSQHTKGEAVDITAGDRLKNGKLFEMIVESDLDFDQLIGEKGYSWLHISFTAERVNRREVLHL